MAAKEPLITVGSTPPNSRTLPNGQRWYTWQGQEYVSVTTVRDLAGLPYRLHHWQLGRMLDAALEAAPDMMQVRVIPDQLARDGALTALRSEVRRRALAERDLAAKLGTAVHKAAETGISPLLVPPDVAPRLRAYHDWVAASGVEILASEFQVWNLTLGYAGTADLLVRFKSGQRWLVDIKTGRGVYGDHALQVMAYAMAEFVGNHNVVDEVTTAHLLAVDGLAILHLHDDSWTFHVVRFDNATWVAFRGLLAYAQWARLHDRVEDVTTAARQGGKGVVGV